MPAVLHCAGDVKQKTRQSQRAFQRAKGSFQARTLSLFQGRGFKERPRPAAFARAGEECGAKRSDGGALQRRLATGASKRLPRRAAAVRLRENKETRGPDFRTTGSASCDGGRMPVICPTCQLVFQIEKRSSPAARRARLSDEAEIGGERLDLLGAEMARNHRHRRARRRVIALAPLLEPRLDIEIGKPAEARNVAD